MGEAQAGQAFTWGHAAGLVARTVILYVAVVLVVRLMGKRSFKNMAAFDLVVVIMIGEVTALALERDVGFMQGLLHGLVPIAVLGLLEVAVGVLNLRSRRFERLTEGVPTVVIRDGQLDLAGMRKERLTVPDLRALLHDRGVFDWSTVREAKLEQTGELTVLLDENERPVTRRELEKVFDERLAALESRLLARFVAQSGGRAKPSPGAEPGRPH